MLSLVEGITPEMAEPCDCGGEHCVSAPGMLDSAKIYCTEDGYHYVVLTTEVGPSAQQLLIARLFGGEVNDEPVWLSSVFPCDNRGIVPAFIKSTFHNEESSTLEEAEEACLEWLRAFHALKHGDVEVPDAPPADL